VSTAPQPIFDMSKATPIFDMSKAQAIDEQPSIQKKYGLPAEADLSSGYMSDKNSKLKMDPLQFSKAYAEANPPPPEAKGFLANMWGEAKAIGQNILHPSEGTGTASAPPLPGSGISEAAGLVGERIQQAKTDLPGALGKTATDAAAIALPLAISKGIEAIPSAERAGAAFQDLSKSIGQHPVAVTDELSGDLNALRKSVTTTNTNLPPVVKKLIDRLDPFQGTGPLTYDEARAFSSEINHLSAADKMSMTENSKRLVRNLNGSLKDTVQDTADLAGKGDQLSKAMSEYHHAMQIRNVSDVVKQELWKAALSAAGIYGAKKIWDAVGSGEKP
jgi:hypothetical protein